MQQKTLYASAARTATPTAVTFDARWDTSLRLFVDVTAVSGVGPSITVKVEAQDPASGTFMTVLTSSAITTVSKNVLALIQGLSRTVKVTVTHASADSLTYSVGAHLS